MNGPGEKDDAPAEPEANTRLTPFMATMTTRTDVPRPDPEQVANEIKRNAMEVDNDGNVSYKERSTSPRPVTRKITGQRKELINNFIQSQISDDQMTKEELSNFIDEIYQILDSENFYDIDRADDKSFLEENFGRDVNIEKLNAAADNIIELTKEDDSNDNESKQKEETEEEEEEKNLYVSFFNNIKDTFLYFYETLFINEKLENENLVAVIKNSADEEAETQPDGPNDGRLSATSLAGLDNAQSPRNSTYCSSNSSFKKSEVIANFHSAEPKLKPIQEDEDEDNDKDGEVPSLDGPKVEKVKKEKAKFIAKSIATTELSKILKGFFVKGDLIEKTRNLYQELATQMYNNHTTIDVRKSAEHDKTAEKQMKQVWGVNLTKKAKSSDFHCYLCGGNITNGASPEMEHKLPCTYFYAKFPSIFRVFDKVLIEWISWVDEDGNTEREIAIQDLYYEMNPIENNNFNGQQVNTKFNTIFNDFKENTEVRALANDSDFRNKVVAYLQKKNTSENPTEFNDDQLNEYLDDFGVVLKGYLMEFAYSHHYCNQIKSNHFLKKNPTNPTDTNTKVHQYYDYLYAAVINNNFQPKIENTIRPAMPRDNKFNAELENIKQGLGVTESLSYDQDVKTLRIDNTSEEMEFLETLSKETANKVSNTTTKRAVIRAVKDLVRNAKTTQVIGSSEGTLDLRVNKNLKSAKKAVKEFVKLFNPNVNDTQENIFSFANNLNKLVENLKTFFSGYTRSPSDRILEQKAQVFIALLHQYMQLNDDIKDFVCDNNISNNEFSIANILNLLVETNTPQMQDNKDKICKGFEDVKNKLEKINENLNDIFAFYQRNGLEFLNVNDVPELLDIQPVDESQPGIEINATIRQIEIARNKFECSNKDEDIGSSKNPPKRRRTGEKKLDPKRIQKAKEAIDQYPEKNKKDSAGDPKGGSRRRIKKRRPSRTRRNKSNLKSKSKTKTRKQKRPKLKRNSKKRKESSRRSKR